MDMAELAARTGFPVRKLRYAFDHRVLPGLSVDTPGQGIPRTFTEFEGFGIALAARLLDAGLSRKLVAACLLAVCRSSTPPVRRGDTPLFIAYRAIDGRLLVGDGRYIRVVAARRPGVVDAIDTGWRPLKDQKNVSEGYNPMVLITIVIEGLARSVRGDRKGRF
jgi:hypothetical protein